MLVATAKFIEEFLAPALLAVIGIKNFEPALWARGIRRQLVLGDYTLTIASAHSLIEPHTRPLDVIGIEDAADRGRAQEMAQHAFTVRERKRSEVLAIKP